MGLKEYIVKTRGQDQVMCCSYPPALSTAYLLMVYIFFSQLSEVVRSTGVAKGIVCLKNAYKATKCCSLKLCCGSCTFSSDNRSGSFDKRRKKRKGKMKVVYLPASGKGSNLGASDRGREDLLKRERCELEKRERPSTAGCCAELR